MSIKNRPTMNDVARIAGVSSMTVSRALRPDASVSEKTRIKILRAADELGYILDSTASGFSTRKTGFVAVIIPSIDNANFADTVRGLTDGLVDTGLQILLGYTDYSLEEEEKRVIAMLRRRPEAIVVTGGVHSERCRRYLEASGVPVIEIWDTPAFPIGHVVGFSNMRAGRIMARHLYDSGYRKIGFIGGTTDRDRRGADRRQGFELEISSLGLSTERFWQSGETITTMGAGRLAMQGLLTRYPDTDAVMCVSDLSAFGAMMTCRRKGLEIAEDIAIAGFGAYEISANSFPEITTIDVGAYDIGTKTAELIEMSLSPGGDDSTLKQWVEVEIRLLQRDSTTKTGEF